MAGRGVRHRPVVQEEAVNDDASTCNNPLSLSSFLEWLRVFRVYCVSESGEKTVHY